MVDYICLIDVGIIDFFEVDPVDDKLHLINHLHVCVYDEPSVKFLHSSMCQSKLTVDEYRTPLKEIMPVRQDTPMLSPSP